MPKPKPATPRPAEEAPAIPQGVIVTRPKAQSEQWVQRLKDQGVQAFSLPLIEIAPPPSVLPLVEAWRRREALALIMFVSPNAVSSFFKLLALKPGQVRAEWPAALKAGSIGPGTSAALRLAGVPGVQIVEPGPDTTQFDSEALWARLGAEAWSSREVLVVRGAGGRDWLAQKFTEAGATVSFVQAYDRRCPTFGAGKRNALAMAVTRAKQVAWLFSSSESIENLLSIAPDTAWGESLAVATHPRIAEQATAAGFGQVLTTGPTLPEIVAALPSHLRSERPADAETPAT